MQCSRAGWFSRASRIPRATASVSADAVFYGIPFHHQAFFGGEKKSATTAAGLGPFWLSVVGVADGRRTLLAFAFAFALAAPSHPTQPACHTHTHPSIIACSPLPFPCRRAASARMLRFGSWRGAPSPSAEARALDR
jgi:hypothetical protein